MLADPDPFVLGSAMTAVSVLTRVLPFLLETYTDPETGEVDPAVHRMFWSKKEKEAQAAGVEAGGEAGDGEQSEEAAAEAEAQASMVLGSAVVSVAMRLLFTRQLTVDVHSTCDAEEAGGRVVRFSVFRFGA